MPATTTIADRLAVDLASYGARRCFGLLGTANFRLAHALVAAGVELIAARHEGNAASMADAYAKATGELTLVSVHCGPGLSNALTGIAEAAKKLHALAGAGRRCAGRRRHVELLYRAGRDGAIRRRRLRAHAYGRNRARGHLACRRTRSYAERKTVVLSLPTDVQDAIWSGPAAPLSLPPRPP